VRVIARFPSDLVRDMDQHIKDVDTDRSKYLRQLARADIARRAAQLQEPTEVAA